MVTPELVEGIKKHLQDGDSEDTIREHVLSAGYSIEDFHIALRQAKQKLESPSQIPTAPVGYAAAASESTTNSDEQPVHAAPVNPAPEASTEQYVPNAYAVEATVADTSATAMVGAAFSRAANNLPLLGWTMLMTLVGTILMLLPVFTATVFGMPLPGVIVLGFAGSIAALYVLVQTALAVLYALCNEPVLGFWDGWRAATPNFWSYIGVALAMTLVMMLGLVALIIPGVILAVYLSITYIVFAKEGKKGAAALARSTQLIYGVWWGTFGRLALLALAIISISIAIGIIEVINGLLGAILNYVFQCFITLVVFSWALAWYDARAAVVPETEPTQKSVSNFRIAAWAGAVLFVLSLAVLLVIAFSFQHALPTLLGPDANLDQPDDIGLPTDFNQDAFEAEIESLIQEMEAGMNGQ